MPVFLVKEVCVVIALFGAVQCAWDWFEHRVQVAMLVLNSEMSLMSSPRSPGPFSDVEE